jgi:hypothetical protein
MPHDCTDYSARNPRHLSTGTAALEVKVKRASGDHSIVGAELVDLSRSGFRLRAAMPLAVNESVTVRFLHAESGLDLTLPSTVRWQRPDAGEKWLVGFETERQVEWETLGELFLNDILHVDQPGSH